MQKRFVVHIDIPSVHIFISFFDYLQMVPDIEKFFIQGCELVAHAGRDTETLMNYLDKNLIVLKQRLNEKNFDRILSAIWESSAQSLAETIQLSIDVRHNQNLLQFNANFVHFFATEKETARLF